MADINKTWEAFLKDLREQNRAEIERNKQAKQAKASKAARDGLCAPNKGSKE